MPKVTYVDFNGGETTVDVPVGNSVMQGAMDNMVDGVLAECGGACACATCHVIVDDAWADKAGEASSTETEMLDFVDAAEDNSRLSCQIKVTDEMDGLVVRLPESQF